MNRLLVVAVGVVALGLGTVACGKGDGDKSEAKGAEKKTVAAEYSCSVFLKKKSAAQPVTGTGSVDGDDEVKATEAAWKDACAKLAAADQPDCQNKDKWTPAISTGKATVNGKTSTTVTIQLAPEAPQVTGKAKSTTSKEAACQAALADGCKKGGAAEADCVASGAFERNGESTSKTSIGM